MNWLLRYFFPTFLLLGMNFFASAPVAEVVGGADGAESGADISTDTPTNDPVDSGDPEVGTQEDGRSDDAPESQPADAKPEDTTLDARTVPAEVRTHLAELRAAGKAQVADKIANSFAKNALWYKEFNGGVKEARELKQVFTDLGGKEGIKDYATDKAQWNQIDEHYLKGDAALVDGLAQKNPEAFSKLAENALVKWGTTDPASYDHALSGVLTRTIEGSGMMNALYLARELMSLGKTEEAAKKIEAIENWAKGIDKISKTPPAKKAPPAAAQPNDFEARDKSLFDREVGAEVDPNVEGMMNKEVMAISGGKGIPEGQRAAFRREIKAEIRAMADKDERYTSNFARYEAAKDKTGLIKLVNGKYAEVMNAAVKSVYNRWYRTSALGGKKPAASAPGAKPAVPGAKPVEGWTKVQARPNPDEVNRSRVGGTTDDMIMRGDGKGMRHQAILKSGKKIFWD